MPEATSDQDQLKKGQEGAEAARPQPAPAAPQPELEALPPALKLGPGLGSPDGFEQRASDPRQRRGANQHERVQTLRAMQHQFGNQHVQRFMVQRQAAGKRPVQREEKDKDDAGSITIDEKGVTTVSYDPPSIRTSNEVPTPSPDAKPGEDKVDVTATVTAVFKATTNVSMPSAPGGLSACQTKRVQEALKKLAAHEAQHVAAMKQYDGTYTTQVTVKGVTKAAAPDALVAAAKPDIDTEGARRKKVAQDASDLLDQPPFVIIVDLNCEDQKPGKKDTSGAEGAQPEMAGSAAGAEAAGEGGAEQNQSANV